LRADLLIGDDTDKPGFVRLNMSYMMDEATVAYILASIPALISAYGSENRVAAA
jgi:hypothetical protein